MFATRQVARAIQTVIGRTRSATTTQVAQNAKALAGVTQFQPVTVSVRDYSSSTTAVAEPTVSDLLTSRHSGKQSVLTVPLDATIQSAARLMMSHKIGSLVVTDAKSKEFQGIVTERDLLKVAEGVVDRDAPVSEVMTGRNKIVACTPTDSIFSVMTLINNNNIRHVPVIQSGANKVEAVVSIKDCIDHVIKTHQKEIDAMKTFVSGSY